jgi:DNA-directed RNA polymerase subunit L
MAALDSLVKSSLEIKTDAEGRNATFLIGEEDHTLGNSLRYVIATK